MAEPDLCLMAERMGIDPSFDPAQIKDLRVRGFVNYAIKYAINQKTPSKAVARFFKDLVGIRPEEFEKRYCVPAENLTQQLMPKNKDGFIRGCRRYLKELAEDFSTAERYWNRIFEDVIDNYFRDDRGRQIRAALCSSQWYPFLTVLEGKNKNMFSNTENHMLCFFPTDYKQKKRLARLTKTVLSTQQGLGWLYTVKNFQRVGSTCGLYIEKIQQPKITGSPKISIPQLPDNVLTFINDCPEGADRLLMLLAALHNCVNRVNAGEVAALQDMCTAYEGVEEELKKWGNEALRSELEAWWARVNEIKSVVRLCSPQSFCHLDFLPAFLAGIRFMELNHPKRMAKTEGVFIDTTRVEMPSTILGTKPKERDKHVKLLEILGANACAEEGGKKALRSEHVYFIRFQRT